MDPLTLSGPQRPNPSAPAAPPLAACSPPQTTSEPAATEGGAQDFFAGTGRSPAASSRPRPPPQLPRELVVQVLAQLTPNPLDLVRLGAASQVRRDALASAARDPSLWRRFTPERRPLARQLLDPATQFVARLDGKPTPVRAQILDCYDLYSTVAAQTVDGITENEKPWLPSNDPDMLCAEVGSLHHRSYQEFSTFPHEIVHNLNIDAPLSPFADRALMITLSAICPEFALLASKSLLSDPSYLREYALRPPCSACAGDEGEHEDELFLFPFHRLDARSLEDETVVRTALQHRPDSYENLPDQMRRIPWLFLHALQCFEDRWPSDEQSDPVRFSLGLELKAMFRQNEREHFSYPGRWVHDSVLRAPKVLKRALEISPAIYLYLPLDSARQPTAALRYLTGRSEDYLRGDFKWNFRGSFPATIRANLACMQVVVDKRLCLFEHLRDLGPSLADNQDFVKTCSRALGVAPGEVVAEIGKDFARRLEGEAMDW